MDEATRVASLHRRLTTGLVPGELWQGTPHLLWTGVQQGGYGLLWDQTVKNNRRVHRIVWELEHGPIPDGLVIDHLCRVTLCAQVAHLEPVTNAENIARGEVAQWQRAKTHCPAGHAYTPENTRTVASSRGVARFCRACDREAWAGVSPTRKARAARAPRGSTA